MPSITRRRQHMTAANKLTTATSPCHCPLHTPPSRPWAGRHMVAIAHAVSSQRLRPPLQHVPDDRCPPALRRLVQQCWEHDARRRPAAAEAAKELAVVKEQASPGSAFQAARRNVTQLG